MTLRRWTVRDEVLLAQLWPTTPAAAIAAALGRSETAVRTRAALLGLRKRHARKVWTDSDRRRLAALYPDTRMSDLIRIFGASERSIYSQAHLIGAKRSAAFLEHSGGRLNRGKRHSPATEFKKGHVPFNKGRKGGHKLCRCYELLERRAATTRRICHSPIIYGEGATQEAMLRSAREDMNVIAYALEQLAKQKVEVT